METPDWTEKYSFVAEWFDPFSSSTRTFHLSWFPSDNTLELYDAKYKKSFLRRTRIESITLDDLYIGNSVIIYSRQLKIIDFVNDFTRKLMAITMQKTFAIITPDGIKNKGNILKMIIKSGFKICQLKMFNILTDQIEEMFQELKGDAKLETLIGLYTSGPVIALELVAPSGMEALLTLAGPDDPEKAKTEAPTSIRALYGYNIDKNAIYVAPDQGKVNQCLKIAFRKGSVDKITSMSTAVLENSTCCVVKPHAVRAGHLGDIILAIEEEGFNITAMEMFLMDHINAGDFLEVYNGIVNEFPAMVAEFLTGGSVAMEITHPALKEETPAEFRKFCGPTDPDVARQLRPTTLRARFGVDKVKNAVHVTDLPEDGILDVEYFFRIMQL